MNTSEGGAKVVSGKLGTGDRRRGIGRTGRPLGEEQR